MRNACLSVFVLLISVKGFAQETAEPIKNKSNRIILHFKDTTGLFTRFAKFLTDRSYDLEIKDREAGVIKTKVRNLPGGWAHSIQIRSIFRDSTITLSATQPKDFTWDIFYVTRKGSTFYQTWNELIYLGNQLKPESITYMEQK
jgi:hypothetical protein